MNWKNRKRSMKDPSLPVSFWTVDCSMWKAFGIPPDRNWQVELTAKFKFTLNDLVVCEIVVEICVSKSASFMEHKSLLIK